MSDYEDEINTKPLDNLIKSLKENNYVGKIGILGNKNARSGPSSSNATVGAAHEFGTETVPRRSFLRMPIETQFKKELDKSGALNEKEINIIIKEIGMYKFTEKMCILAVSTVLKAFDTGGFGTWAPLKEETLKRKKVNQILVESQQLRDSIDYEVVKQK